MARIKLKFESSPFFKTELQVRASDLNYGNHMSNDRFLAFAGEVRMQFLQTLGLSEINIGEDKGWIMGDAAVCFKGECFFGDVLEAELSAQDISKIGLDFMYRFTRKSDAKIVAEIKTGMLCFDYVQRKMAPWPVEFLKLVESK